MPSAADRNVYRLQGALHRAASGLRRGRESIFKHFLSVLEDPETVGKIPMVADMDKVLGKPIGNVTRRELIEMWLGKEDLEAVEELLQDLDDGNFTYADYDGCIRRIGALRRLLEG